MRSSPMAWHESLRRKVRTALTLSLKDWWIFLQAWVLLLVVDLGLRLLPYRRVERGVGRVRQGRPDPSPDEVPAAIQRLERLVDIAARNHLYSMRCLPRSLVLQRLLAHRGIRTDLRFGVRKEPEGLVAHAWLELGGRPIGEPKAVSAHYAPLVAREAGG